MAGGLRYETGRDMPPGMQELAADKIAERLKNAAPVADIPEFTCCSCGCKTNNSEEIGQIVLHLCDECNNTIEREVKWESEGEHRREKQVICPFCDYEYGQDESLQFEDGDSTVSCEWCLRQFHVEVSVVHYYTTRRSVLEMPQNWTPEEK